MALSAAPGFTAEPAPGNDSPPAAPGWDQVRSVAMQGDWKVLWNVGGGDREFNNRKAVEHGFRLVNLLGTYTDYRRSGLIIRAGLTKRSPALLRPHCMAAARHEDHTMPVIVDTARR